MKLTRKNMERLTKNVGYDPFRVGEAIMKELGYEITTYTFCPDVYVKKNGKMMYWRSF